MSDDEHYSTPNVPMRARIRNMTAPTVGLQELSEEAVMSFDPLPPTDSIDLYKSDARRGGGGTDDPGTLSLFLRSLLPNFDVNAPAAQA